MVHWELIMSVTQDSQVHEPNFGGNLSLAQDIWYIAWQMSHVATKCILLNGIITTVTLHFLFHPHFLFHLFFWVALQMQEPPIATATCAPPKEEKASNSATLSPKREVLCVSLIPVKTEKKRKDGTPSPSSPKMVIDLTAEAEEDTFPLTQLSEKEPSICVLNEKESIVYEREMYRSRAWATAATPAKAQVSQDLSGIPSPFARARLK